NFIREVAQEHGNLLPTTSDLSAFFEARASHAGYGWIARIVAGRVGTIPMVVVTGVRNREEVEVYRGLPGFRLVKLEADFEIRYERWCARQRPGEQDTSREALLAIERLPGNANVGEIMALPGSTIHNIGTKRDLYGALDLLVARG
ncbi:MAG: hypothetical protein AAB356_06560, partial [Deltaproteobacteria bacterium]